MPNSQPTPRQKFIRSCLALPPTLAVLLALQLTGVIPRGLAACGVTEPELVGWIGVVLIGAWAVNETWTHYRRWKRPPADDNASSPAGAASISSVPGPHAQPRPDPFRRAVWSIPLLLVTMLIVKELNDRSAAQRVQPSRQQPPAPRVQTTPLPADPPRGPPPGHELPHQQPWRPADP